MPDDGGDIVQGVFDIALLVQFQKCLPVLIRDLLIKLCLGQMDTLFGKLDLDLFILHGKFLHGLKGRQFCRVGVRVRLGIQRTELVNANHIKGIHQPAAGGVRGMMAVGKLILVENNARLGVCRNIVVAPRHGAVFIHIGEKGVDGIAH